MLMTIGLVVAIIIGVSVLLALFFRRVVDTNEVHIIQSRSKTVSYGKDTGNGNVYYEIPAFIPIFGVKTTVLPVSVFGIDLNDYESYDKGRLPFVIDVKAFFRISDANTAAQRVSSIDELHGQLTAVVQGAVRSILAKNEIEMILEERSLFGDQFTKEVDSQLGSWGVQTVKSIELMDIRDHKASNVITNIMEKKKSFIEMESRTEVAKNKRIAQIAETEAQQAIEIKKQEAMQSIGLKTTENQRNVALANEEAMQVVKDQQKATKEKEMAILKVANLRQAEIEKDVQVVKATAQKESVTLTAQGQLEAKKLESAGIQLEGAAKAEAEKAMQLAPVQAQITLAKEIGENKEYQEYLVTIRQIEKDQAVGIEQAKALSEADVKVISNTGTPVEGVSKVMDLFTAPGGTQLAGMVEAFSQSDTGKAIISKFTGTKEG